MAKNLIKVLCKNTPGSPNSIGAFVGTPKFVALMVGHPALTKDCAKPDGGMIPPSVGIE